MMVTFTIYGNQREERAGLLGWTWEVLVPEIHLVHSLASSLIAMAGGKLMG